MSTLEKLDKWIELATCDMRPREVVQKYRFELWPEEMDEAATAPTQISLFKELCDVFTTLRTLTYAAHERYISEEGNPYISRSSFVAESNRWKERINELTGGNFDSALNAVTDSNMSKLISKASHVRLDREIIHFNRQGIIAAFIPLVDGYISAVSAKDQTVGGKYHPKGKLLKPSTYKAADETKEFWL